MDPRAHFNQAEANKKISNSIGLTGLPNDILLEILSHIPSYPLPKLNWIDAPYDPEHRLTLVSLSQTCQSFRGFFLRHVWRRIEAQYGQSLSGHRCLATYKQWSRTSIENRNIYIKWYVDEIVRQLEVIMIRNPSLAEYVQEVNLNMPGICDRKLVQLIAQSLSRLPNLHTLQLDIWPEHSPNDIYTGYTFPKLHTLLLPCALPSLVNACPNLLRFFNVESPTRRWWQYPIQGILKGSKIEVVGPLNNETMSIMRLVEEMGQLRQIIFGPDYVAAHQNSNEALILSKLKYLELICVDLRVGRRGWDKHILRPEEEQRLREIFCKALEMGCRKGSKSFIFIHENGQIETFEV